ncbi:30S ribosomal protein S12 methylthiotransferase RimO [Helicobacter sp. faydin-H20]|uniref:30S ribosomal protein S12 methylthiotransferase RimO n=1 Tax=Helicobacter anatolicus TaxID=2905874 RepID=UPI001E37CBC5|nr:30S ribosomal protein S12 methylthiotransferase RimO [Helicobacter anatolicus]MCE3037368.1 30S ribosomal protein S12 methylthiotransferase RimO [Helicobacter anatolicus]
MEKTLHLVSLGCTKNLVDSEVMLGRLKDYEVIDDPKSADVIIVNTCGFIQSAKEESIAMILQMAQEKKEGAIIVASGCLTQRYQKELKELIPEIDIITGVGDYDRIDVMISQKKGLLSESVFLADEKKDRVITGSNIHAYIKISEGCNQSCSFCSIPSFKGKLKSRSIDSILKEIEILTKKGYRDFTFIAQDSSSYLRDEKQNNGLISLINAIDQQDLARSARILYLYPTTTSIDLIWAIKNSKIFQNYFDMPIQHMSAEMLKRMKRGASKEKHIELLRAMREVPNSFVRSTIIVGHPQESEEEFQELCEFLENFVFDRLNIFAFSSEEGTLADSMQEKIPVKIINQRIKKIDGIIKKQQKKILEDMVGRRYEVLLEGKSSVSEYFYSARVLTWAPEVDGEILINDSELEDLVLEAGYYQVEITEVKNMMIFAKVTQKI